MKLLPDKPINDSKKQKVDFAYKELANSLSRLIESAPRPFTIGLFGKWGAGKSTVIHNLRDVLDRRKYIYLTFDVWKYESDALRRSFLIDIARQLNKVTPFYKANINIEKLEEELYKSKTIPKEKLSPSYLSLGLSAILGIAVYLLTREALNRVTSLTLGLVPLLVEAIRQFQPSMFLKTVSVNKSPIGSPEEFERIFKETFLDRTNKTLVIVIDNLDRTQKEKTVELLSTVKTFLNSDNSEEKVVFVIACDDKAIKEHIKSIYRPDNRGIGNDGEETDSSEFNPNEFLRKFFNAIIELPVLIENEVTDFTKNTLGYVELEEFNSDEIRQIINYAYEENPREIKQYINNLASFYILLSSNMSTNGLTEEFLKNNLNFISKMLVIRDKYENQFEYIKRCAINALPWTEIMKKVLESNHNNDFTTFHENTNWAEPTDEYISWFFRLRRSKEDQALPGWDQFVNFASQQNDEEAKKLFDKFTDKTALNNQIRVYINRIRHEPTRITPFFSVFVELLLNSDEGTRNKLSESVNLLFQSTPKSNDLAKIIGQLNIDATLTHLAPYMGQESVRKFTRSIKEMLESAALADGNMAKEHLISVIEAFDHHQDTLKALSPSIRNLILNKHTSFEILDLLKGREVAKTKLINNQIIHKYVEQLNPKSSDIQNEWGVLQNFSLSDNFDLYIEKINPALGIIQNGGDANQQRQIVDSILNTLRHQNEEVLKVKEEVIPNLVTFCQQLSRWYPPLDESGRSKVVLTLSLLSTIPGNTARSEAIECLREFVKTHGLDSVLSVLRSPETASLHTKIQEVLRDRAATNNQEATQLLPFLEPNNLNYVLSHVAQKAIDAPSAEGFVQQMDIANQLYQLIEDESSKQQVTSEVVRVLEERIRTNAFPETVKAVMNRRTYKYISAQKRKELLESMKQEEVQ